MRVPRPSRRVRLQISFSIVALLFSTMAGAGVGVWTTNGPAGSAIGVVTDPRTPGIVYAGGENGIFKSTDNGATWALTSVLGGGGYVPLAAGTTVYATGPYTTPTAALVALFASTDQGAHWRVLTSGDFGTSYLLAVDPVTPTTLYLATYFSHGLTTFTSLARSADGGLTWADIGATLGRVTAISIAPSEPGTLYAATTPSPLTGGVAGVSKSLDYGATWDLLTAAPQDVTALVTDPSNSSIVYAATQTEGVQKSTDGGKTFFAANRVGSEGILHYVLGLCIDPLEPNRLYETGGQGVYESVDGGANWQSIYIGLRPLVFTSVTGIAIDATGAYVHITAGGGVYDYQISSSACGSNAHALCLNGGRFSVTATFQQTPEGPSAPATAVPLTNDTGYFWFFDPSNVEMVVKVLTGCPVNDDYWVFAGGLTNVGVEWKVTDTLTGTSKSYSNAAGTPFQPVQDSSAFPCP